MPPKLHDCCATTFGQALIGAVVFWAALPPLDLWPLAWIAPVWWILLIRRQQLPGARPYRALWLVGFLFWLAAVHWVRLAHWTAYFGWVALAFYLAFYLPVFVGLTRVAVHQFRLPVILAAPMVWTGLELARGHFLTGFTMASLCHTQYRWIGLIQLSDLAGAYGVSFVMMLAAACLARMIPCREGGEGWRLQSPLPPEGRGARGQGSGVGGQATGAGEHTRRGCTDSCVKGTIPSVNAGKGDSPIFVDTKIGTVPTRRSVWPLLPAVGVVAAALVYGHFRVSAEDTSQDARPQSRIALIQGSIDTEIKFNPDMQERVHDEYSQLSRQALTESRSRKVALIVWPETMFRSTAVTFDENPRMPGDFDGTEEQFRETLWQFAANVRWEITQLALTLDAPLILGVDRHHYGPEGIERFNSALYVARDGQRLGHYDKVHLVVFGEYVPFVRHFPPLQRLTPVPISISPGSGPTVFKLDDGLRIAPNICYETVIPHVIRRQVNALKAAGAEPDVLVNLTNDGWFRGSSELDMHLACGVFRAVECRKPLLIAANTGFSAFIDGEGRIRAQGPRRATATILADVAPDPRSSFYLRYGDWPAGICLAGCVAFGVAGAWGRLRGKQSEAGSRGSVGKGRGGGGVRG